MTEKELRIMFEAKELKKIENLLSKYNAVDLENLLAEFKEENRLAVFRLLDSKMKAEVFAYMEIEHQKRLIAALNKDETKVLFKDMYTDDIVDFLSEIPEHQSCQILELLDQERRTKVDLLLKYADDSVGSIMTDEFISLKKAMTVKQALEKIRKIGINSETVYTCYVVEGKKLIGIVSAKDLMIHDEEICIQSLVKDKYIFLHTDDDKEVAANLFRKYSFIAIPVIDENGYIVGIVTFDDAIGVLIEETTEDMQIMAAMAVNDEPYLKTSVWKHAGHRIMWLLVLMLSATITGSIIASYENAFVLIPLLVSFIPMLMDTGGNCGTQSSTLIIRGLAVGELDFSDTLKIVWNEFQVALIVSVTLAFVNGLRVFLMYQDVKLALVVSISLIGTIIIAKLVGGLLPMLANKIKLDPAIMAAPIITTIVDTTSIIIYFKIATVVLNL